MSRFTSSLASEFEAFLKYKRTLGCRYWRAEYTLREFDRFVAQQHEQVDPSRLDRILGKWLAKNHGRKPVSVTNELGVIRQFCLWRRRTNPKGFVPGREWAPQSTESTFFPYIFTIEEVRKLLRITESLSRPDFRAPTYRALLLVLYCTGLRFGEALRLRIRDVDAGDDVIFVEDSKGRSRWVPFDRSLASELERYLVARREYARAEPGDRFFVGHNRCRLPIGTASGTVRELLRTAGLKPKSGRVGPRPYDLRHYSDRRIIPPGGCRAGTSRGYQWESFARTDCECGIITGRRETRVGRHAGNSGLAAG